VKTLLRNGTLALLVARTATQLCSLLAGVLVARNLGVDMFGSYAFYWAVGTMFIGGGTSGIPVFVLRETAAGRSRGQPTATLFALFVVLACVGGSLAAAAVALAAPVGATKVQAALVLMAFSLLAVPPFFSAIRIGRGEISRASIGEGLVGPVALLATWATLTVGGGMEGALVAQAVGGAVGTLVLCERLEAPDAWNFVGLARTARIFIALGFVNAGYVRVDALAVAAFGDIRALALYSAACRLLGPVSLMTSAFGSVIFARLSALTLGAFEWKSVLRRGTVWLAGTVSAVTATLWLLVPIFMREFYGDSFEDAVLPARLLLLSGIPLALYWPMAHALNASFGESRWLRILLIGMMLNLFLVSITVSRGGATAAALWWCISETLTLVFVFVSLRRHLRHGRSPQETPSSQCA
jgi:O-antigen/teichoic acid export membrane protein